MTSVGVGAMKIWWRFGLLATRQKDMDDLLVDAVEDSYQVSCNSLSDRIGQFFQVSECPPDERAMQVFVATFNSSNGLRKCKVAMVRPQNRTIVLSESNNP